MIRFIADNVQMPSLVAEKESVLARWIQRVAAGYGFAIGEITYILCDDEKILQTNRQFLQHDYYTDVITFDYSSSTVINGDIFISLDTVSSNAQEVETAFDNELSRILIHGVLHLTGQGDKTPLSKAEMTRKENKALAELETMNC
ncbi:MAG: rRNA maturation RNase YbeY [Paludibacteraceae bacterium]|nr:rRNA maturation RNase YbeY [Paludibacteraceae bacterium]